MSSNEGFREHPQYLQSKQIDKSSLANMIAGVSISALEEQNIQEAQSNFQKEVGPEFGFDL